MGKLISIIETARRFGMTEQTLRNWIKEGHITVVKSVGRARYFDEDTVNALQDTVEDIQRQKAKIEALREQIRAEHDMLFYQHIEEHTRNRYIALVSGAALKSRFFHTVLHIMQAHCGLLKEREAAIVERYLNGESMDVIAMTFGISRERVRQMIEKAIRKSSEVEAIDKALSNLASVTEENIALKALVEDLKGRLKKYEHHEPQTEEKANETNALCALLSKRLVDCDLTVRALNCLRAGRYERKFSFAHQMQTVEVVPSCETVGDLCRLTKTQLLMLRNMGKKTLLELDKFLEDNHLCWGMDVDKYYQQQKDNELFA